MARRTQVIMIDDLTGKEADDVQTIQYMIDGTKYEIDLDTENALKFHKAFERWIKVSRNGWTHTSNEGMNLAEVRRWAQENGFPVGDRGRIPAVVLTAYNSQERNQD